MSSSKAAQPLMVTDAAGMARVCQSIRRHGIVGFDTEFIRERSFLPQLCLLQVATADLLALVDPFRVDLVEFWRLVADPAVVKVVHAGNQDLEIGYLCTQLLPAGIFDVQVAAALTGLHYPLPYGKLVHHMLGVRAPQDHTVSDWSRRPLSKGQIEYAAADVLYLLPLHGKLLAKLRHLGREDWLREEMRPLEACETYVPDPARMYQRVRGWDRLRGRELAVLKELILVRERGARQADMPARTYLKDEVLTAVARHGPQSLSQLEAVRGMPGPLVRQIGQAMLEAVRAGLAVEQTLLPAASQDEEDDPGLRMLADLACGIGQALCLAGQVNHALLASRSDYLQLVRSLRRKGPAEPCRLTTGWREEFAGRQIVSVLNGHTSLRVAGLKHKPGIHLE